MTRKTMKGADGYLYKATISEPHLGHIHFFRGCAKGTDKSQGKILTAFCGEKSLFRILKIMETKMHIISDLLCKQH